jgi:hypothetical protein
MGQLKCFEQPSVDMQLQQFHRLRNTAPNMKKNLCRTFVITAPLSAPQHCSELTKNCCTIFTTAPAPLRGYGSAPLEGYGSGTMLGTISKLFCYFQTYIAFGAGQGRLEQSIIRTFFVFGAIAFRGKDIRRKIVRI